MPTKQVSASERLAAQLAPLGNKVAQAISTRAVRRQIQAVRDPWEWAMGEPTLEVSCQTMSGPDGRRAKTFTPHRVTFRGDQLVCQGHPEWADPDWTAEKELFMVAFGGSCPSCLLLLAWTQGHSLASSVIQEHFSNGSRRDLLTAVTGLHAARGWHIRRGGGAPEFTGDELKLIAAGAGPDRWQPFADAGYSVAAALPFLRRGMTVADAIAQELPVTAGASLANARARLAASARPAGSLEPWIRAGIREAHAAGWALQHPDLDPEFAAALARDRVTPADAVDLLGRHQPADIAPWLGSGVLCQVHARYWPDSFRGDIETARPWLEMGFTAVKLAEIARLLPTWPPTEADVQTVRGWLALGATIDELPHVLRLDLTIDRYRAHVAERGLALTPGGEPLRPAAQCELILAGVSITQWVEHATALHGHHALLPVDEYALTLPAWQRGYLLAYYSRAQQDLVVQVADLIDAGGTIQDLADYRDVVLRVGGTWKALSLDWLSMTIRGQRRKGHPVTIKDVAEKWAQDVNWSFYGVNKPNL